MWAQSTAIDAAIKANPSRGGGAKLRVSFEEVAGLPNSDEGSTTLRPTKHEGERRLSHTVSPFTEGLTFTSVLQVKIDQTCAAMVGNWRCARPHVWGLWWSRSPCCTKRAEKVEGRGSNLTTYKKTVEGMTSYPILGRVLPGRSFTR